MHLGENYKEKKSKFTRKDLRKRKKFGKRNENKNKEKPVKSGEMEI